MDVERQEVREVDVSVSFEVRPVFPINRSINFHHRHDDTMSVHLCQMLEFARIVLVLHR